MVDHNNTCIQEDPPEVFTNSKQRIDLVGSKLKTENPYNNGADFETAIAATGFGCFNIVLLLVDIPAAWASRFSSTTMSYVFPVAQCDLNLSLSDKGLLNAAVYVGMIASAVLWGYLADTLGRKKLLVIGYLLDAFFVLLSAASQTFVALLIGKFFGGFIINGPFAVLVAFLSEFHSTKYRAKMLMLQGLFCGSSGVIMPLLAWAIIPLPLNFTIGSLEIHSWGVFLAVCALPSLIAGCGLSWMPESPKFLMTTGKNKKALKVFQKIYVINSKESPNNYPIKSLVDEIAVHDNQRHKHGGHVTADRTKLQALTEGLQQIKPLFFPPHLPRLLLVLSMDFLTFMGVNTLRLWLPQLFTLMNDYHIKHGVVENVGICEVIDDFDDNNLTASVRSSAQMQVDEECTVNFSNDSVYINAIIVGAATTLAYIVAGSLIIALGKKKLLFILLTTSGACGIAIYWATNTATIVTLSSLVVAFASVCSSVLLTVTVDLFPTHLRTMTIALSMMCGRIGAMSGNLIFPYLLLSGCGGPFFLIGGGILITGFLSTLIPNTDMKALK